MRSVLASRGFWSVLEGILMKYRSEIDGLRALAVIPVILFHAGFTHFSGGFIGVDIFFVISGFLITTIIMSDIEHDRFSFADFYMRRARRILPALYFIIIACIPFSLLIMLPSEIKEFSSSIISVITFTSNIFFWLQTGYFESSAEIKPLLHTWSLSVEEQYYILFPLLLVALSKVNKKVIAPAISIIFGASLYYSYLLVHRNPEQAFFLLPSRGWEILAGALCGIFSAKYVDHFKNVSAIHQLLSALGLLTIGWSVAYYEPSDAFPGTKAILPVMGASLVLLYARAGTLAAKILGHRTLVAVGLISYSAYLWHQPILAFARLQWQEISDIGYLALIALTLFASYLTWLYIETPFRKQGALSRFSSKAFAGIGITGMLAFCVSVYGTSGFLNFYSPQDRVLSSIEVKTSGHYVADRASAFEYRNFSGDDGKPKLLIIGDSFAQDLVNAIHEIGAADNYDISVRHIKARCGNLFMEKSKIESLMPARAVPTCQGAEYELYTDAKLKSLMHQADMIWIVSKWKPWQASVLPESIKNIISETGVTPLVFGTKSFGQYRIRDLLKVDAHNRSSLTSNIDHAAFRANMIMKSNLEPSHFVDVLGILCPSKDRKCHMFTDAGELISPDGDHLTKEGAVFMGRKLEQINIIKPAAGSKG